MLRPLFCYRGLYFLSTTLRWALSCLWPFPSLVRYILLDLNCQSKRSRIRFHLGYMPSQFKTHQMCPENSQWPKFQLLKFFTLLKDCFEAERREPGGIDWLKEGRENSSLYWEEFGRIFLYVESMITGQSLSLFPLIFTPALWYLLPCFWSNTRGIDLFLRHFLRLKVMSFQFVDQHSLSY